MTQAVNECILNGAVYFLQDEEVILQNPSDVPVFVQVLPLALLPKPSVFSGKLADRWELTQALDIRFNHYILCSLYISENSQVLIFWLYFAGYL